MAIEKIFDQASDSLKLLSILIIHDRDIECQSNLVIGDDRIRGVTFTGSSKVGAQVAASAGKSLKKVRLELGGSDAFVVLPGTDIDKAVTAAVRSRFKNTGQSCNCAKRFIIDSTIHDAFLTKFTRRVSELMIGNPASLDTKIGPLAREDIRTTLASQIQHSVREGATLHYGGHPIASRGYYFHPTILTDVRPGMPAFDEETFGPLACISKAYGFQHALQLANATEYGLSICVWSGSSELAKCFVQQTTTGMAYINALASSDIRLPFGGTKRSGYGREMGAVGIREFCNVRSYVSLTSK